MNVPLYQAIARAVHTRATAKPEWAEAAKERADWLCANRLPSGSGWDCGTKLDWDRSTANKLIFYGSYHFMAEGGMYDGWGDFEIWVRPSLCWYIDISVKGRNRDDIKDYLGEMFQDALEVEVDEFLGLIMPDGSRYGA